MCEQLEALSKTGRRLEAQLRLGYDSATQQGGLKMAFNKVGDFTIEPDATIDFRWWWPMSEGDVGGEDRGAQFLMAHPMYAPGKLMVSAQGKEQSDTQVRGQVVYFYHSRITLEGGTHTMHFSIEGGGFI
jgi:hypothetical protein